MSCHPAYHPKKDALDVIKAAVVSVDADWWGHDEESNDLLDDYAREIHDKLLEAGILNADT